MVLLKRDWTGFDGFWALKCIGPAGVVKFRIIMKGFKVLGVECVKSANCRDKAVFFSFLLPRANLVIYEFVGGPKLSFIQFVFKGPFLTISETWRTIFVIFIKLSPGTSFDIFGILRDLD